MDVNEYQKNRLTVHKLSRILGHSVPADKRSCMGLCTRNYLNAQLWLIYVVACIRASFLFRAEQYSIVCICHFLFIQSAMMDIQTVLAIVNNTAVNTGVQNTSLRSCFQLFWVHIHIQYIVELLNRLVILFFIF